jgi:hypothetical protein
MPDFILKELTNQVKFQGEEDGRIIKFLSVIFVRDLSSI